MRRLFLHIATTAIILLSVNMAVAGGSYADAPPSQSEILHGYSYDEVRNRLDKSPLQPIEGIWDYPDEMMTVVVERFSSPLLSAKLKYRIVLLNSDDTSLLPGTVVGYISESADNSKFELWIYCEQDGMMLHNAAQCVATLSDDATSLTFKRNSLKARVRINLTHFLPKLFKFISISPYIEKEDLPIGFSKVYPAVDSNGSQYHEIRYL